MWIATQNIAIKRLLTLALAAFYSQTALAGTSEAAQSCNQSHSITQAARTVAVDGSAPVLATVTVPDRLTPDLLSDKAQLRYTLALPHCPGEARALWIFRAGAPYVVTTEQGEQLKSLVDVEPVGAQYNGRVPALFALPPGEQRVHVLFQTKPHLFLGLLDVVVGPITLLLPREAQALEDVVGFGRMGAGILLMAGLLTLFLWLQRRSEASLFWLGAGCVLWGVRGSMYLEGVLTLPARWFELINPLMVLGTAICAAMVCMRLAPTPTRAAGRIFAVLAGAAVLLALVAGAGGPGMALSIAGCLLAGYLIVWWLLWWLWSRRKELLPRSWLALAASVVAMLIAGGHDMLMLYRVVVPSTHPYFLFWGFATLLAACLLLSASYVVRRLHQAEVASDTLEHTVKSKTAQLEASYALLGESEREAARLHERESLLREMHDGIGAQLMTALRGVERGAFNSEQVQAALQDSLDDLRMLMDSADMGRHLPGALATWRNRWDPRLAALGLALDWSVEDSVHSATLAPDAVLQLMRILQEATANVVKHAGATRLALQVKLQVGLQGNALHLSLQDNGCGLPDPPPAGGRGLRSMHTRAQLLGGPLTVQRRSDGQRGTVVSIALPLHP